MPFPAKMDELLGDSENIRRIRTQYSSKTEKSISAPFLPALYQIEPTNHCNFACTTCPNPTYTERGLMEFSLYEGIIEEIADYARAIKLSYIGEPLLHPRIFDMIALAKKKTHAHVYLFSNGSLLDRRAMVELKRSGLDHIVFSLDAHSDALLSDVRKNANGTALRDNIEEFIDYLCESRAPKISINCVSLDVNNGERAALLEFWKAKGCEVSFSPYVDWHLDGQPNLLSGSRKFDSVANRPACAELWYKLTVRYDGTVVQCCNDLTSSSPIGDCRTQTVREIWQSSPVAALRRQHRVGSFDSCAVCSNRSGRLLVLLVVVHLGELGVDDVFLRGRGRRASARRPVGRLLVHRLAELHRSLRQRVGLGRDRFGVVALQGFLEVGHGVLDRATLGVADLGAVFGERFLGRVDQSFGVVLGFDLRLALLVFLGVSLGVLHHLLDVGLGEAAGSLDADLLLLAGALVPGRHVDDAVGVDVEGDLDLRHAARRRRQADEIERAEQLIVGRHLAFALEHADRDRGLAVLGGGEHLALLGRDRGVAVDEPGEHAAERLDAERQRGHVEQQHVLDVALEHAGLDGGADATTSSGLTPLCGSLPNNCFTTSWTFGMRVMPPTRTTSLISAADSPAP